MSVECLNSFGLRNAGCEMRVRGMFLRGFAGFRDPSVFGLQTSDIRHWSSSRRSSSPRSSVVGLPSISFQISTPRSRFQIFRFQIITKSPLLRLPLPPNRNSDCWPSVSGDTNHLKLTSRHYLSVLLISIFALYL